MKKIVLASLLAGSSLFAHSALMSCFDNGDNTITCEGGFSDGSSASGTNFFVKQDGKNVITARLDQHSEYTFDRPAGEFDAVLDAGDGHLVTIKSKDIAK